MSDISGVKPVKAYKNFNFLNGSSARQVRILCEYEETLDRLKKYNVGASIMVFGSARCFSEESWAEKLSELEHAAASLSGAADFDASNPSADYVKLQAALTRHNSLRWMCAYYNKIYDLSKKLTAWAVNPENRRYLSALLENVEGISASATAEVSEEDPDCPLVICTGGGPGLMEAANKGAFDVPGGRSMGMGISLPFEPSLNPYVSPELAFEYHYFFTRKFWMIYMTVALVATPGGFGTLDELFEVLTLKQTGKIKRDIPIVLFGAEFWKNLVNWDYMVETGVVSAGDRDQLFFTDDVDEAFNHIVGYLTHSKILLPPCKSKKYSKVEHVPSWRVRKQILQQPQVEEQK